MIAIVNILCQLVTTRTCLTQGLQRQSRLILSAYYDFSGIVHIDRTITSLSPRDFWTNAKEVGEFRKNFNTLAYSYALDSRVYNLNVLNKQYVMFQSVIGVNRFIIIEMRPFTFIIKYKGMANRSDTCHLSFPISTIARLRRLKTSEECCHDNLTPSKRTQKASQILPRTRQRVGLCSRN